MESFPAKTEAEPTARPSERLFWLLHMSGWLGYAAYSLLTALGHGKPFDYWVVVAVTTAAGLFVTTGLRFVLRYLMKFPVPVFVAASALPILLCSLLISPRASV